MVVPSGNGSLPAGMTSNALAPTNELRREEAWLPVGRAERLPSPMRTIPRCISIRSEGLAGVSRTT